MKEYKEDILHCRTCRKKIYTDSQYNTESLNSSCIAVFRFENLPSLSSQPNPMQTSSDEIRCLEIANGHLEFEAHCLREMAMDLERQNSRLEKEALHLEQRVKQVYKRIADLQLVLKNQSPPPSS